MTKEELLQKNYKSPIKAEFACGEYAFLIGETFIAPSHGGGRSLSWFLLDGVFTGNGTNSLKIVKLHQLKPRYKDSMNGSYNFWSSDKPTEFEVIWENDVHEITMDEIAAKFKIPVEKLKIKK